MKCKPKNKPRFVFANQSDYIVVAIRENKIDEGLKSEFLILNDDFLLQYQNSSDFDIVDNDKSNFVCVELEKKSTNLLIDFDFINIYNKSLDKDDDLEFKTELWDLAWLSKSFSNKNLKSNNYIEEFNNDYSIKLNTINGFLLFANDYILFHKDSDSYYEISFYTIPKENSRHRFQSDNFRNISIENYENYLTETIDNYLFNGKEIRNFDGSR